MLSDGTVTFMIRGAIWALLACALWSLPGVKTRATEYRDTWTRAWNVDAKDCNTRAYGLLFKGSCEE